MEPETDPGLSAAPPPLATRANDRLAATPAWLPYAAPHPQPYDPEHHDLAVSSVMCGVMVCAPFITGMLSLCFGIAVLRHARRVRTLDLVIAVFGVLSGGVNLGVWIVATFRTWPG